MVLDTFKLEGKVAVVTGGGQGLGKVFCHAFADAGADIVIAEMNPETGPQVVDEIKAKGRRALFVQTDVTDSANVDAMVQQAVVEMGQIDVLMNNAGIVKWGEAENVTDEDWLEVVNVNLNGLFYCARAVGKHMIQRRTGSIINIASMSGIIANRPQAQTSYNATKAAVMHLTKSLAVEWAQHGLRVNAMSPGYMGTAMAKPFFEDPQYGGVWIDLIPMKRPGEPEELGPPAVFLASDASSYMTGHTLVIDGGYTCW